MTENPDMEQKIFGNNSNKKQRTLRAAYLSGTFGALSVTARCHFVDRALRRV